MSERSERVLDAATIVIMTEPSDSEAPASSERSERVMDAATSVLVTGPSGSEAQA
ncbi:hypothetical protein [Nocardia testacea]|uniref:hypothetical protein n=1 Tax=Nocardia testacea TaxID=248551 RepID=UPI003A87300C